MKVLVDRMYVRIAEITSTSDMQFKMLMAFVENVLLPRNIEAGQLSGEIFRTSDNSCFVVSRFTSKEEADKIMQIMKSEMEELRGNNRIRFLEGERFKHLSRTDCITDSARRLSAPPLARQKENPTFLIL